MVDGEIVRIEGEAVEISQGEDRVYVVVDRLVPTSERNVRFTEAVRVARSISSGRTKVWDSESGSALNLNQQPTCGQCGRQYQELATIDFFAKTTEGIAHKVLLEGKSLAELEAMPLAGLRDFVEHVEVGESFAETLEEACAVGLGRLSLGRSLDSLSGGEWQRLQLVSCISGGLTGILYIFDGLGSQLHPEILPQVVAGVRRLVDRGNTALLLDHAPEIVAGADRVCEFVGGKAVDRTVEWRDVSYVDLVSKQEEILDRGPILTVRGEGPLGKLDIKIPHGALTYVGGPSGSGKTRFLREVIWPLLKGRKSDYEVSGAGGNVRVVEIGTSRREKTLLANLGVFARIADLYAASPVAQERGLGRDAFQLDKPGGRCPSCEGRGQLYFDMDFLEDISLVCAACDGRRFREEIQEVTLRGASIADVLEMGVERARSHFARESKLRDRFNAAVECGLGHLRTGQNPGELERGEWLRLCLALEWNRASARDWLLLDHPSCGDHPADVQSMIEILRGLVAKGATIVVADHWPPVQQAADWSVHMAS
jgi:excinuclease ABC subunit A